MAAILADGELILSGDVGADFYGDFFTYSEVVIALAQVDDEAELPVRLNSGGGVATEGAAIHALLSRRSGKTNIIVEGIAASAASLIAMAGDTVTMAAGSSMMIHDPSGITIGTSADHAKTMEGLEALATGYARIYAAKSGKKPAQCREIMKAETWFTAEQAVAAGFADEADAAVPAKAVAAFDYRIYAHAPDDLRALAKSNSWTRKTATPAATASSTPKQEEIDMTEKERADGLAAELAELRAKQPDVAQAVADAVRADRERRSAILALDEAKGREPLAEALLATAMTVDEIKAALAVAPKASAEQTSYEAKRLAGAGLAQPRIVAEPGAANEAVARIVGNYRSMTGAAAQKNG